MMSHRPLPLRPHAITEMHVHATRPSRRSGRPRRCGPRPAVPSERQLRWHELETTAFLHFTINTFTDKEWGYGDEDPNLFQPARFDPDAIVGALAEAGMRGVILTCKHHDGFCLWPTATTEHSIRATSWRGGKGDVVRDIADAARGAGCVRRLSLAVGPQLSALWHAEVHRSYRAQLTELLTRLRPDLRGLARWGEWRRRFYGGAREKRTIDKRTYYDWPNTWRWCGNSSRTR